MLCGTGGAAVSPFMKALRNLAWLTQLGLSIAAPPLLCIWGCWWLQERFSLGGWIIVVGIVLGLGGSVSSGLGFYRMMNRRKDKDKKPPASFNSHE